MTRIPVDSEIPIRFASAFDEESEPDGADRAIILVPDDSGWNDFGKNFRLTLNFVGFGRPAGEIHARMMFPGAPRLREMMVDLENVGIDDIATDFVAVFAEASAYRTLVEQLGFADAFGVLRRMHDIVVAQLEGDTRIIGTADGLDFTEGVLRDNATWGAVRNGGRYLTPHPVPDADDAAHSFALTAALPGFGGKHELDADFGDAFPLSRRSLVLVGENGVGKSQLLSAIVRGLQRPAPWEPDEPPTEVTFLQRPTFSRLVVFSAAASDTYPTDIPPWRGVDYRLHRMVSGLDDQSDDLAQSLLDVSRAVDDVRELRWGGAARLLQEMLEPLGVTEGLHVEVTRGDEEDKLPRATSVGDRLYLPFFGFGGEERPLQLQARMMLDRPPRVVLAPGQVRDLSSGEQVLLRFATQAIGSLRPGTMFFLDEPETHLHPRFISILMSMLDRLLELSGSIALIATHSAFIVREVPARRVQVLRKGSDGEMSIDSPRLQTFGASIDRISQFVFGDLSIEHRFEVVLDRWLEERPEATLDDFRERYRDDLNAEMLSYFAQRLEERGAR